MGLFGKPKTKSYLGVDIGVGGAKMVELVNEKGRARLMTYAYHERPIDEQGAPLIDNPELAAKLLVQMVKKAGVVSLQAISGLPQHAVFSTVINVPKTKDEKQFKTLVDAQLTKLTPLPLTEMVLDSKVIDLSDPNKPKAQNDREIIHVLVTGAARTLVQKYVQIFKLAKIELVALETESFALIRSLIGKDRSIIMVLDIGAVRTNVTIVEKGIPLFTRSVNVGGGLLTQSISRQMGISLKEAEQMKLDIAKGGQNGEIPPAVEQVLQPILTELNYSMGEFRRLEQEDGKKIEKLIITGGSAQLPGISQYLSGKLNMNCYVGDPWARVVVPSALRPVLDEIGPRFAVPVGLAMRDIE